MVEVYVPFLLLVMSWNTADPAQTMAVSQRLFLDEASCRAAGAAVEREIAAQRHGAGETFVWRCIEQVTAIEVASRASRR